MLPFSPIASTPLADDGGVSVVQYSLTADAGTFTYSGQDAVLQFGDNFIASEGSFALTGQDVSFTKSVSLSVVAGSFGLTGQDAGFGLSTIVSPNAGSFASTVQDATFDIGFDAAVDLVKYDVSVASGTNSYGTGNKFYVSGSPDASPTLRLQAGITYRFDQSDSSNSGHPFRFSTTPDGTHDSGSEYTTGVTSVGTAGSAGAYVQIEVTGSTPTLYYYCTNHSSMGGKAETNGRLYNVVAQDADLTKSLKIEADFDAFAIAGQAIGYGIGESLGKASFALNEQPATFTTTALLDRGTFGLTGLPHNKAISELARHVALLLEGQDSAFEVRVSLGAGVYDASVQDAVFTVNAPLENATYATAAKDASLTKQVQLDLDAGVYDLTGQKALKAVSEAAGASTFALSGVAASFTIAMPATSGLFSLAGEDALKGVSEATAAGVFTFTLQDFAFKLNISLAADTASFAMTGQGADVTYLNKRFEFSNALTTATAVPSNSVTLVATGLNAVTLEDVNAMSVISLSPNKYTLSTELNEAA